MKKKGFTLIELLAVIVILAIIALIAVPSVLNIIEDSKKGAAEASARNIVSAAKTYYMQSTMNGGTVESIDLSTDTLKYDGEQANKGSIIFTNGKASGKLYVSGYCVEISIDGKVTSEKKTEDECEVTSSVPEIPVVYTKYVDGTPLYFDPINNVKCETPLVGQTGLKDGCMKWYAFLDNETSSTVNLLLGHNTTGFVVWSNTGSSTTAVQANEQLSADILGWNVGVKSTARLISAEEVNRIAPANFDWKINETTSSYYLHNGKEEDVLEENIYVGEIGTNKYAWLFDMTDGCEDYGCYKNDSSAYGYWTSSKVFDGAAWLVSSNGTLTNTLSSVTAGGIRPVITVDKSVFK